MAKRKIIQYGNPTLETPSEKVNDVNNQEVKDIIKDMLDTLEEHKDTGAGLSAPQIGVLKRIAICRRLDLEGEKSKRKKDAEPIWEIMINPEIVESSKEMSADWEGCLSINYGDLFGKVLRPKKVKVRYTNEKGEVKELTAEKYFSHVVGHELDHLDGKLFLRYVTDPTELYTGDELYRK